MGLFGKSEEAKQRDAKRFAWVRAANDNEKILAVAGRFPFPSGRREPAPNAGRTWTRADFRRQGPRAMGDCAQVAVPEVRNARRSVKEWPRAKHQFWLTVQNLVGGHVG